MVNYRTVPVLDKKKIFKALVCLASWFKTLYKHIFKKLKRKPLIVLDKDVTDRGVYQTVWASICFHEFFEERGYTDIRWRKGLTRWRVAVTCSLGSIERAKGFQDSEGSFIPLLLLL
jgi:hypothetical protein